MSSDSNIRKKNSSSEEVVIADKTLDVNIYEVKSKDKNGDNTSGVRKANRKVKRKRSKNPKTLGFNWVFWVGMTIIIIPCALFGWILLSAYLDTGVPVLGNRFVGDLTPAIEETHLESIKTKLEAIEGVESCNVNTVVATMRVSVNVKDDLDTAAVSELAKQVYEVIGEVLPVETYFTFQENNQHQYDLEVSLYNNLEFEEEFVLFSLVKNSKMEEYILQDVSTPLNPTLAVQLWEDVVERDNPVEEEVDEEEVDDEEEGIEENIPVAPPRFGA